MDLDPEIETALKRLTETTSLQATTPKPSASETSLCAEWRNRTFRFDESGHPLLAKASKGTESLVKRFKQRRIQPFCLLVLIGRSGSGKTHLAKAAVRAAGAMAMAGWEQGYWPGRVPSAAFCDWPAFADSDADGIARDLEESDFVALDDIGAEVDRFKSGKPAEILRRFLGFRANRFTIVTTNVPQANWSAKWDERVADRLCRNAFIVDISSVPSFSSCKISSSKAP